ncbi:phospholipase A I [Pelomyxa schiedti]|nr:phospholipase A I [Pelomyxa schiedti]
MCNSNPDLRPTLVQVKTQLIDIGRKLSLTRPDGKYNILSLDGGGMRGLVEIEMLMMIEKATGKKIWELFHLISGTSTGGILAIAIGLLHVDLNTLKNMYMTLGVKVFGHGFGFVHKAFSFMSSLSFQKYSSSTLRALLALHLSGHRFLDFQHCVPKVFVTSTQITSNGSDLVLFRSYPIPFYEGRNTSAPRRSAPDCELVDGAMATASAPTYFEPVHIGQCHYVDGGLLANNPTEEAINEAKLLWPNELT